MTDVKSREANNIILVSDFVGYDINRLKMSPFVDSATARCSAHSADWRQTLYRIRLHLKMNLLLSILRV